MVTSLMPLGTAVALFERGLNNCVSKLSSLPSRFSRPLVSEPYRLDPLDNREIPKRQIRLLAAAQNMPSPAPKPGVIVPSPSPTYSSLPNPSSVPT